VPPTIEGNAARLKLCDKSRFRGAALRARQLYPGNLGELAHRELTAYVEFGYRFAAESLVPRLAAEILAAPAPAPPGG
jgi:hypothetical protein